MDCAQIQSHVSAEEMFEELDHVQIQSLVSSDNFTQVMFEELLHSEVNMNEVMMNYELSLSAMEFFIDHSDVDDFTCLSAIAMERRFSVEERTRLLIRALEKGRNINDQCSYSGMSILFHYVDWIYDMGFDIWYDSESMLILSLLLERGADPLLQDKHGDDVFTYIREYAETRQEYKFFKIMMRYLQDYE